MKERNHTFDFLCGICIMRMMCNHAISMCGLRNEHILGITWYELMGWTFFFMCFFFFKAGYFNKTVSGNSVEYCKDRVKRLLVPYISWSIIGAIIFLGFIWFVPGIYEPGKMVEIKWSHLWETSHTYGNGPCWFLMSFFTAYIAIHFIEKVKHLHWIIFLFPFISYWLYTIDSPLWLSLDNVFMGIFFFFLGRVWKVVMQKLRRTRTIIFSSLLVIIFIIGNICFHGEYTMSTNDFDGNMWGILVNTISILCGLSGILLSLPLGRVPLVNYIGEHSMVYFVAHYPLMYLYIFTHKAFGQQFKHNWGECLILIALMFIVCTWLVPYVERVPWLSGRWKKKDTSPLLIPPRGKD